MGARDKADIGTLGHVRNEREVLVAEEVDACGTLGGTGVAEGDLVVGLNSVRLSKMCRKK